MRRQRRIAANVVVNLCTPREDQQEENAGPPFLWAGAEEEREDAARKEAFSLFVYVYGAEGFSLGSGGHLHCRFQVPVSRTHGFLWNT